MLILDIVFFVAFIIIPLINLLLKERILYFASLLVYLFAAIWILLIYFATGPTPAMR